MLKLNCDLGELVGEKNNDALIMPLIDQANIACGGHAGNERSMHETVALAQRNNVAIGAHPSYPDKTNFGRKTMTLTDEALVSSICQQVQALHHVCSAYKTDIKYIKPHGALYNDMMKNLAIFNVICKAVSQLPSCLPTPLPIMIQAIKNHQPFQDIANKYRIPLLYEAFADRAYQANGLLLPRTQKNAVIHCLETVKKNISRLIEKHTLYSIDNTEISVQADSLCVHGDNEAALAMIHSLRQLINNKKENSESHV